MYNVNGINTDPSTEACGASIITFIVCEDDSPLQNKLKSSPLASTTVLDS